MRYIKKFESIGHQSPMVDEFDQQGISGKVNLAAILNKLMNGFAVEVDSENIEEFLSIMSNQKGIESPKYSTEYKLPKYFFVVLGDKLLHTHHPTFGGFDLRIYKPTF
jgi:hypothetical protein